MSLSIYEISVPSFIGVLGNLPGLLEKGAAHARSAGEDPDGLVEARMAPDMHPLRFQIQTACDQAKSGSARLMGVAAPVFEDNETTLAALQARVEKTIAYLQGLSPEMFEGAETREITLDMRGTMVAKMNGFQFLRDWCFPNFYFHVSIAYGILRNRGAEIGKRDFMMHAAPYMKMTGA